mgnify:CR=1 FL=1
MTEKLRPCPFCGGEAAAHKTPGLGGNYVMCSKCLTSGNNYPTPEIAVEHWNRRIADEN